MKNNEKPLSKNIYEKIVKFRKYLIPGLIIAIPLMFILYVLNVHNYILPDLLNGRIIFRLDKLYKLCMFILAFMYVFQVIYEDRDFDIGDYGIFIFIAFTVISTFTAYDFDTALTGFPYRFEGMFTLLFYAFLFLNCKLLDDRKKLKFYVLLIAGDAVIQLVPAILQDLGIFQKFAYLYDAINITGLTENCNFLGSIACTLAIMSLGYFLFSKSKCRYYYLTMFLISYILILMANSTGPFISFVFTIFLMIVFAIVRKYKIWKKLVICLVCMIALYPLVLRKNDTITPEIKNTISYFINLVKPKEKTSDNDEEKKPSTNQNVLDNVNKLGHGRIRIWKNVLKSVKKRPILGFGPDNLGLVYEKSADDSATADKAHNIYLHILVSSGVFAFAGYLVFVGYNVFKGLKSKDLMVNIMCFTVIVYSVQGFFNINVNEVTPYFYLIIGIMVAFMNTKGEELTVK